MASIYHPRDTNSKCDAMQGAIHYILSISQEGAIFLKHTISAIDHTIRHEERHKPTTKVDQLKETN